MTDQDKMSEEPRYGEPGYKTSYHRLKEENERLRAELSRRAPVLSEEEKEAMKWADEVVVYEPGAKRGHMKASVLAALVRRLLGESGEVGG